MTGVSDSDEGELDPIVVEWMTLPGSGSGDIPMEFGGPAVEAEAGSEAQPESSLSGNIARSTASLTLRRVALIGISFVSTLFITRKLGPSSYGALQAGLATWGLIIALCDFGVSMALSREMAKDPASQPSLLRATYWVQGAWAVLMTLAMAALAISVGGSQRSQILLVLAPSILVSAFSSGRTLFLVRYEMGYVVIVDLVTTSIQTAAMIAVVWLGFGPVAVAAAISAGTIVNSIWIGIAAHRRAGEFHIWRHSARRIVKAAAPLGAMGILSRVYLSIDLVILGFMRTGISVGNYAVAVKIASLANTIPGLLVASALPGVSSTIHDEREVASVLSRLLHWTCAIVVPMFVALGIYAHPVTRFLVGTKYDSAAQLLSILSLACLVGSVSQLLSIPLVASVRMRALMLQNSVAVAFNIGLNIALIPVFGPVACAWLTVGTELIVCVGAAWTVFHMMKIRFALGKSPRCLIVTVVAGAAGAALLPVSLPISLLVSAAIFAGGLYLVHGWPEEFHPLALVTGKAR